MILRAKSTDPNVMLYRDAWHGMHPAARYSVPERLRLTSYTKLNIMTKAPGVLLLLQTLQIVFRLNGSGVVLTRSVVPPGQLPPMHGSCLLRSLLVKIQQDLIVQSYAPYSLDGSPAFASCRTQSTHPGRVDAGG